MVKHYNIRIYFQNNFIPNYIFQNEVLYSKLLTNHSLPFLPSNCSFIPTFPPENCHTWYLGRDDFKSGVRFFEISSPESIFWQFQAKKSIPCLFSFETLLVFGCTASYLYYLNLFLRHSVPF